jgi:hypothetical protein
MFFQQSPLYAVIVIGAIVIGYLYIKSKRSHSGGSGFLGFMKGNPQQNTRNYDDLITLMMLQQLIGTNNNHKVQEIDSSHKEEIDQIKQEVLDIFDE